MDPWETLSLRRLERTLSSRFRTSGAGLGTESRTDPGSNPHSDEDNHNDVFQGLNHRIAAVNNISVYDTKPLSLFHVVADERSTTDPEVDPCELLFPTPYTELSTPDLVRPL